MMAPTKDIADIAFEARQKFGKYRQEFQRLFGKPLKEFWDLRSAAGLLCGFDLVKLEKEIVKSRKNESMTEALVRKFGAPAKDMIADMLRR